MNRRQFGKYAAVASATFVIGIVADRISGSQLPRLPTPQPQVIHPIDRSLYDAIESTLNQIASDAGSGNVSKVAYVYNQEAYDSINLTGYSLKEAESIFGLVAPILLTANPSVDGYATSAPQWEVATLYTDDWNTVLKKDRIQVIPEVNGNVILDALSLKLQRLDVYEQSNTPGDFNLIQSIPRKG